MEQKKANPFYKTAVWQKKRQEILERDHYECLWCKEEGKVTTFEHSVLEVDHIKELEDFPELALENDNLRTLCKHHHNIRHDRFQGMKFKPKENKWAHDEKW